MLMLQKLQEILTLKKGMNSIIFGLAHIAVCLCAFPIRIITNSSSRQQTPLDKDNKLKGAKMK